MAAFNIKRSPNDEKLFQPVAGKEENVVTSGRGSYGGGNITFFHEPKANVLFGRFCSLAGGITFLIGGNHPLKNVVSTSPLDIGGVVKEMFDKVRPNLSPLPNVRHNPRQIIIGHDVWIGMGVTIMGGVKIGNGAVVGTNSVVAKDIPPYAIAVGNPARVIKYRFDEETIRKMLAVKWWNWDLEKIADNFPLMNDFEKFLEINYSPELEFFPEDTFSRQLERYTGGGDFYHFIPDFIATNPLWPNVVKNFRQTDLKDVSLVIWLGNDATEENINSLVKAVDFDSNIFIFKHEKLFSPAALRKGTHFITTREMTTLEALDYLWNTNVKIISALDDDIF